MQSVYLPMLQIRDRSALIYSEYIGPRSNSFSDYRRLKMRNVQKQQYSGMLSPGARKRLSRAVTLLVQSSKKKYILNPVSKKYQHFQLSFITLTVSDPEKKLTGKEAYELLLQHFYNG